MATLDEAYTISATLFESVTTIIYQATRQKDGARVCLKAHKRPDDIHMLQREYELLKGIVIQGIANVLDLFRNEDGQVYLVMEDHGGIVLEDYLRLQGEAGTAMDALQFLVIAQSAVQALTNIHTEKIVHRDIKPANLLIDAETLRVWVIDFGIAVRMKRGVELRQKAVEGTLEYMPPEQTGRINRPVDTRSDIYSLGVTLYRILTGRLPFSGKTTMEIIHRQIAERPIPPIEYADVPEVLSECIMKMLEKQPEKRYQTAEALAYDLARCHELVRSGRQGMTFRLGERDIFHSLGEGKKLYGRADILAGLRGTFDRINRHRPEVVLLDGEHADGMSLLLDELIRHALRHHALIFRGDAESKAPSGGAYHALRDVFGHFDATIYEAQILLSAYRESILRSLGDNAQVLIDILPQMQSILGKQPAVPTLGATETQQRAEQVFSAFVQTLTDIPYPCLFIFDEARQMDEASLRMMMAALENPELGNCMFVFALQDADQTLRVRLIEAFQSNKLRHVHYSHLHMQPLSAEEITEIIQDIFPQKAESARDLAQHVHAYSQGTMRRVEALLKELYQSGAIRYDEGADEWIWDRQTINPSFDEDLRGRIMRSMGGMTPETMACIKVLACVGQEIPAPWIQPILESELALEETIRLLRPALDEGMLVYDGTYLTFETDQLCQAVYAMSSEDWREETHLRIGRRLYARYQEDEPALILYCAGITRQFSNVPSERWTDEDRRHMMRMNRMAGDDALLTLNTEKAMRYYAQAVSLLGDDPRRNEQAYGDVLHLLLRYASGLFDLGDTQAGMRYYEMASAYAFGEEDRFDVYWGVVRKQMGIGDWTGAGESAMRYMADAPGMPDASADMAVLAAEEKLRFDEHLAAEGIEFFLRADMTGDSLIRRFGAMLAILAETSNADGLPEASYFLYRTLNYAYANGPFPEVERTIALLAARLANDGDFQRAEDICNYGIIFAEMNDLSQTALWAVYCLYIIHWVEPLERIAEVYQKTKHIAITEGNSSYGAMMDVMLLSYSLFTDTNLRQAARDVEIALQASERMRHPRYRHILQGAYRQFIRCMTGRTKRMDSFDDRVFTEEAMIAEMSPAQWGFVAQFYCAYRIQALYTYGYDEMAVEYGQRLLSYEQPHEGMGAFLVRVQFVYYYALAMLRLCEKDRTLLKTYSEPIRGCLRQLSMFAERMPENFLAKYQLVVLVWERLTEEKTLVEAIRAYGMLGETFAKLRCRWDEAAVQEMLMEAWAEQGLAQYEALHGKQAYQTYSALDASLKAMQFPFDDEGESLVQQDTLTLTHSIAAGMALEAEGTGGVTAADYRAILGVIGQLVSETNITSLLRQLLRLLMENADADKAMIFLMQAEELSLQAFQYADTQTQALMSQELPMPMESIPQNVLPKKVIALSVDKRMNLIANSADNEYIFLGDAYLEEKRPESFACLPILASNQVIGVAYLENGGLADLFPPPRAHFLHTIIVQASLLIQNALEMRNIEGYTADLEKQLASYITQSNTLIAGIAHEVNTPLGVCVTVATRLRERSQAVQAAFLERKLSKTALEEYLADCCEGTRILSSNMERASGLIQNFKQIAVDQSNEVFEEIELMQTLRNIAEYIRPATKRVIEACTIEGPQSLMLWTSSGALAQIFTNLIMNSANHAFPGREKHENHVTIEVSETEHEVQIIYSDNGRGMTEEEREKIFVPFFTTKRGDGGSGLGGHIIMSLVTQTLRGTIHCISEPGQGTSFVIRLPKAEETRRTEHV